MGLRGEATSVKRTQSDPQLDKCTKKLSARNVKATVIVVALNPERSKQADAMATIHSPIPDEPESLYFTDPPYYFAVPYADLWLTFSSSG